jgi:ketosteroid isomerase-like protein
MQTFADYFDEFRIEPGEFLDAGDRVVVIGRFRGRAAGGGFDVGSVWVWTLREIRGYAGTARA